ncbi:uncharacterized protein EAF01_008084 [Botrytis porri]|uniref:uncharacterized protein n=1 Tax=Botrytis porri TaxID=87229 RepID=UPI0018FFCBD3|nr:uncharacterized protein EAF01_008084 [Botrytis porri]KAF7898871.1 hypothetical protein EAF01_008084 [Botrytis porri]
MDDEITPVGETHRTPELYESVIPDLARLLLSQHLPSVDGKGVTVDEFAAVVEKATANIHSKRVFLQLQLLRPDYVQFLVDQQVWETFCGTPTQKHNPHYRPFPRKDPRIDNPLPQYFDPSVLTPDDYGLIYRNNLHPNCPNCTCGTISRGNPENQSIYEDGGVWLTTPKEEYNAYQDDVTKFCERLEEKSKRLGYKDLDVRWERECEIEQAKEAERIRNDKEQKRKADIEAIKINEVAIIENAEESQEPKRKIDLEAHKIDEVDILDNAEEPKESKTKTNSMTKKAKVKSAKKLCSGCFCM